MKPVMFKNEADLMNFIDTLPVSENRVKVPGLFDGEAVECGHIIGELKLLVPRMFELRALLVKGIGGVGSYKSLDRLADVVSDNAAEEHVAAYGAELEKINTEVTALIDGGLNEEIAAQLSSARSQVSALKMIKDTVGAFDGRFQALASRVRDRYQALVDSLDKAKKQQKATEAKNAIQTSMTEFSKVQESVESLAEDLHKYCALQIAYNSSVMG
jgi:hypothetical protein